MLIVLKHFVCLLYKYIYRWKKYLQYILCNFLVKWDNLISETFKIAYWLFALLDGNIPHFKQIISIKYILNTNIF